MRDRIEVTQYPFPELSNFDVAFSTLNTPADLLAEAEARGFLLGNTEFNTLFSELFFSGGQLHFKDGLDPEFKRRGSVYLKALMASFEPKHEHKEAVCALLLSELVDARKGGDA